MEKPYVVGIDIGGTNTVFGVVDARGTILYSGSIKTGKYACSYRNFCIQSAETPPKDD